MRGAGQPSDARTLYRIKLDIALTAPMARRGGCAVRTLFRPLRTSGSGTACYHFPAEGFRGAAASRRRLMAREDAALQKHKLCHYRTSWRCYSLPGGVN
jgi:hypothetical protein